MTDVKNMLASDAEDTENYIKGIFESGLCGSTRLREACLLYTSDAADE